MRNKSHLIIKPPGEAMGGLLLVAEKVAATNPMARRHAEQFTRDLLARCEAPFRSLAPQPEIGFRY